MTLTSAFGSGEPWLEQECVETQTETMTLVPQAKEWPMTREDFVARWRTRLSEWGRVGALVDGAKVCDEVLADFEAVTRAEDDAELSLSEAAAESGYSSDHLRRLHRLGKLPAYRKGRNLFFRFGDLPRKPTAPELSSYDPVADARRVISQRHEER